MCRTVVTYRTRRMSQAHITRITRIFRIHLIFLPRILLTFPQALHPRRARSPIPVTTQPVPHRKKTVKVGKEASPMMPARRHHPFHAVTVASPQRCHGQPGWQLQGIAGEQQRFRQLRASRGGGNSSSVWGGRGHHLQHRLQQGAVLVETLIEAGQDGRDHLRSGHGWTGRAAAGRVRHGEFDDRRHRHLGWQVRLQLCPEKSGRRRSRTRASSSGRGYRPNLATADRGPD